MKVHLTPALAKSKKVKSARSKFLSVFMRWLSDTPSIYTAIEKEDASALKKAMMQIADKIASGFKTNESKSFVDEETAPYLLPPVKVSEPIPPMLEKNIRLFFRHNPEPSDAEIHQLAVELGYTPEYFESVIYRLLAKYINRD